MLVGTVILRAGYRIGNNRREVRQESLGNNTGFGQEGGWSLKK